MSDLDTEFLSGVSSVAASFFKSGENGGPFDLRQAASVSRPGIGIPGPRGDLRRKMFRQNDIATAQQTSPLDRVPKFTDVARPGMCQETLHRVWRQSHRRPGKLDGKLPRQRQDIAMALDQRRRGIAVGDFPRVGQTVQIHVRDA